MLVIAHAGHWITYVLFLGPTLTFIGWLGVITWRDRRRPKDDETADVQPPQR